MARYVFFLSPFYLSLSLSSSFLSVSFSECIPLTARLCQAWLRGITQLTASSRAAKAGPPLSRCQNRIVLGRVACPTLWRPRYWCSLHMWRSSLTTATGKIYHYF
jgi:hypothetical protein